MIAALLVELLPQSLFDISYPLAQEHFMGAIVIIPTLRELRHESSLSHTPRSAAHSVNAIPVVLF